MVYTGQPSRGCATCRKRRIKCDEKAPECGNCQRIKQTCPGYVNQFDLAWRDQTTVAKKSVERGKLKRRAAREQASTSSSSTSAGPAAGPARLLKASPSGKGAQVKLSPINSGKTPSSASHALVSNRSSISSSPPQASSSVPISRELTPPRAASPYLKVNIPPDDHVLTFFFNIYILPIRDPLARRGFLEYLAPIYSHTDPTSPFMLSTMAVASSMLSIRTGHDPNTTFSRSYYLRAVKAMRDCVTEQKACTQDEMLIAVLLLQMYELSVGRMSVRDKSQHAHLDGALALIRHRGAANFTGSLSLAILLYVRSLVIDEAFRNNTPVPEDVAQWSELFDDAAQIPGVRLDSINLELAELRSSAPHVLRLPDSDSFSRASQTQHLLSSAITIDRRLKEWRESIPKSWAPTRVFGDQYIPPSVQRAGLYQQHCDVYPGLFLVLIWNKYRLSLVEATRIIIACLDVNPSGVNLAQQEACRNNIQRLVDDTCASIPYFLGDRTQPGNPGDPSVKYPRAPGRPPVKDHYQSGPTMGGWSILGPIASVLKMDINIREGQRQWLAGQMARTARIYRIGKLPPQGPRPDSPPHKARLLRQEA